MLALELQARAHADAADAEFELGADLEERGSVYVVGTNASGQLGLGDVLPRQYFTVVPDTRGAGVCYVTAGYDITFGVTEDHDVLVCCCILNRAYRTLLVLLIYI
jgi:alpha-tubulin suppressor-like RCC1 family protein